MPQVVEYLLESTRPRVQSPVLAKKEKEGKFIEREEKYSFQGAVAGCCCLTTQSASPHRLPSLEAIKGKTQNKVYKKYV
jgi:hypothetical protein